MQSRLLAHGLLALGLTCVFPGLAHAYNTQTVGADDTDPLTSDACRGVKVLGERDATVVSVGLEITEVDGGTPLFYYAYESANEFGIYTQLDDASVSRLATAQGGPSFQLSPPMQVPVEVGTYYVFLVCWNQGDSVRYRRGPASGEELSFGEFIVGISSNHSSLTASQSMGTLAPSVTPSFRIVSSAGDPVGMEPAAGTSAYVGSFGPSPLGSLRGNAWAATEDAVLLGFDQYFHVSSPENLSGLGLEWAVYSCPGNSLAACGTSATWSEVDSGAVAVPSDPYNMDRWFSFEHLQVPLEAGNVYFIGTWWDEGELENWEWDVAAGGGVVDPAWGTSLGQLGSENLTSLGPQMTFDAVGTAWRSAQHLVTVPGKPDAFVGTSSYSEPPTGPNGVLGTVFQVTHDTRLKQLAFQTTEVAGNSLEMGVYLSQGVAFGPWDLVESRTIELQGSQILGWQESGPLDIDFDSQVNSPALAFYMVTLTVATGEVVGWNVANPPSGYPVDFGVRTYHEIWPGEQGAPLFLPTAAFGFDAGPNFRIETCQDCADIDLDGSPAGEDCDDRDAANFPGNSEVCDGGDNNCDLQIDEGFDADGDGWTSCAGDCDDGESSVHPGATETCNGVDDDCDPSTSASGGEEDGDEDGFLACVDCDDDNSIVAPLLPEICDGIDNNCNAVIDEGFDQDEDGFLDASVPGCDSLGPADCDDHDVAIHPGAVELCDGLDNDCDGFRDEDFDEDGDGFPSPEFLDCTGDIDCDDDDASSFPGAPERCDARDNDCDGLVDEDWDQDGDGVPGEHGDCEGSGLTLDCDDSDAAVFPGTGWADPAPELCDGLDNDCDDVIFEDKDGDGFLDGDLEDCTSQPGLAPFDCDDGNPDIHPDASEDCTDGVDNNCDGASDSQDSECGGGGPAPELVDSADYEPPEVAGGCSDCLSSQSGAEGSGLAVLAFALLGLGLRRRRRAGPSGRRSGLLLAAALVLSVPLLGLPGSASAQSSMEDEAQRQLDFAWQEIEAKKWDRALESARSALRLDPSLYTAMLVRALAYEGKGLLKRSQSLLLTYRELTQGLSVHPAAGELQERLELALGEKLATPRSSTGSDLSAKPPRSAGEASKRVEPSGVQIKVGREPGAFGDGYILIGGLVGGRDFAQRPCEEVGDCSQDLERRPGFWGYRGRGFGGGLSVRAEYFFGGSYVGARLRFDLSPGQPVQHNAVERQEDGSTYRFDGQLVGRIPLSKGRVGLHLMVDVAYGLRTFDVFTNVSPTEATWWTYMGSELGGGLGLRVEPGRVVGVEFRVAGAALLLGEVGLNEVQAEVAVALRPVKSLQVRLAADLRRTSWVLRDDDMLAELEDVVGGAWLGVGVSF